MININYNKPNYTDYYVYYTSYNFHDWYIGRFDGKIGGSKIYLIGKVSYTYLKSNKRKKIPDKDTTKKVLHRLIYLKFRKYLS